MKINLTQKLKNFDDTDVVINNKSYTVYDALLEAVLANKQGMPNDEKMARWVVAKKLKKSKDTLELSLEEANKVKAWAVEVLITLIAGQISDVLEGTTE